nr:putative reverse transcriptase domain, ribonuclease H-like domain, aspartic peptidase domain protein [Tanacetum cinerariifolium]
MDEPMENPGFDEEEDLNEFMDDDQDVGIEEAEEWLMAMVMPSRATVTVPSTYEVGGPSTATPVGHPLTTIASGVATQPQMIDDLCVRMSNLEYRHRELVKKIEINQQLQTILFEMENHEGTLISYMSWMEECLVSGKENVVVDALSRKERLKPRRVRAMSITIHFRLKTKILEAYGEASKDLKALAEWLRGLEKHFERRDDGGIYFFDRIWIPSVSGVRKLIMDEAHTSRYSIHPGADKMYYDLRELYWWPGMNRDIAEYVSRCLTGSKVKAEHQKPSGLLQQPEIPEWKWEKITMDLVTKLPKSSGGYDTIWVIVDRLAKSAHFLPICEDYKMDKLAKIYINEIQALKEALGTRLDMSTTYHLETNGQSECTIQTLKDMLRACVMDFGGSWDTHLPLVEFSYNNSCHRSIKLKTARSRQKSYADKRYKPLEFKVGDRVLLKVSPWKGVELSCVHDTFHVSNLKKFLAESDVQVPLEEIEIDKNLCFLEEPIEIVEQDVKKIK